MMIDDWRRFVFSLFVYEQNVLYFPQLWSNGEGGGLMRLILEPQERVVVDSFR